MPYLIGIIVIIVIIIIGLYNSMVKKKNQIVNAYAGMDVQLKKRYDLIPNIVSSVKEYMTHEKDLLTNITQLRASGMKNNLSKEEKIKIDHEMNASLRSLNVAVENYPNLKSNENFIQLQRTLLTIEEQLAAARRFYNSAVIDYNNAIMTFPGNIFAALFNFKQEEVFEIIEQERENVSVKDLFQ